MSCLNGALTFFQALNLPLQLFDAQQQIALLTAQTADVILLIQHHLLLDTDLLLQAPDLALQSIVLGLRCLC